MTRLLGFIIEGAAIDCRHVVHVFVARHVSQEARADLADLRATAGVDYVVHTCGEDVLERNEVQVLLSIANATMVDGWIVLYPYMHNARHLKAPVAVVLPDANPIRFPNFGDTTWDVDGAHTKWRKQVAQSIGAARRVVTFSKHVADFEALEYFAISRDRIDVVPHAPPDLGHLIPFIDPACKTPRSKARAAEILREHCANRMWHFLKDYPFEEARFFVVSTQDRTTKNLVRAAEALAKTVRDDFVDLKMFTTAPIHVDVVWTQFPQVVKAEGMRHDVLSMTQLPRDVHASLYHCATFAVHPSIFEGGQGPFPYYEAVSVGTPCLMADGPHTQELLEGEPQLRPFLFNPYDADALAQLMTQTARDPEKALAVQREAFLRQKAVTWAGVASSYIGAALDSVARNDANAANL